MIIAIHFINLIWMAPEDMQEVVSRRSKEQNHPTDGFPAFNQRDSGLFIRVLLSGTDFADTSTYK